MRLDISPKENMQMANKTQKGSHHSSVNTNRTHNEILPHKSPEVQTV